MAVTSKDIARELKLSQPTVSRILSGDPNHRASFATRERVLQAAEKLGYRPNAIARSLRRGRTDVIGLYNGRSTDGVEDAHATVVTALRRQCASRGLDLLLYSEVDGQTDGEMLARINDGRVDGLIVHGAKEDPLLSIADRAAIPIAAIVNPMPHLFSVTFDEVSAMEALVSHYWRQGYRRFLFVAPVYGTATSDRLAAAFHTEMERRCVASPGRLIRTVSSRNMTALALELGDSAVRTAVCCWNDVIAYSLRLACLAKSVDVPERIAIAGFGGYLPDSLSAGILSMRCDWDRAARTALDWMLRKINDKHLSGEIDREVRLPLKLSEGYYV